LVAETEAITQAFINKNGAKAEKKKGNVRNSTSRRRPFAGERGRLGAKARPGAKILASS
jgi:hypothetical protein